MIILKFLFGMVLVFIALIVITFIGVLFFARHLVTNAFKNMEQPQQRSHSHVSEEPESVSYHCTSCGLYYMRKPESSKCVECGGKVERQF